MSDRIASLPDDLSAPFADRLLLALGIRPAHVAALGEETVIEAAVRVRSAAHRYPMVSEDWGALQDAIDLALSALESGRHLDAEEILRRAAGEGGSDE